MQKDSQLTQRSCWCGQNHLSAFAPDYRLCHSCGTLVSQAGLADDRYLVQNDEADFYGKQYWLAHMAADLGLPPIQERARLDLPQRCVHWLRELLSFRQPPARVLEMGAAHGAFVALMRWVGFDATGLEMSPWVAKLARDTFQIPMIEGPIERQELAPGSFDVIVANDVMEHLPDPRTTLGCAVKLLKPDGLLVIQMPEFVEGKSYAERLACRERFLEHTKVPTEHLYLYSKRSAALMLSRLGLPHLEFCPPMFDYDMYFMASRQRLQRLAPAAVATCLKATAVGRLVLALLDKFEESERLLRLYQESEGDRNARLQLIGKLSRNLHLVNDELDSQLRTIQQQGKMIRAHQAHTLAMKNALAFLQTSCLDSGQAIWSRMPKTLAKLLLPGWVQRKLRKRASAPPDPSPPATMKSGSRI
jgi:2-polyprenyl-3-methyl-5-hydroxy-6-metoxy-1,4-benzoquinol methylase